MTLSTQKFIDSMCITTRDNLNRLLQILNELLILCSKYLILISYKWQYTVHWRALYNEVRSNIGNATCVIRIGISYRLKCTCTIFVTSFDKQSSISVWHKNVHNRI